MPPSEENEAGQLFQAVFNQVSQRINQFNADENKLVFYNSLLAGGTVMAGSVVTNCQGINKLWAGGDEVKAMALAKLFTSFMLFQCLRWIEGTADYTQGQTNDPPPVLLDVLSFFGETSEEEIEDLSNINIQFRYEVKQTHMTHLAILLLARACQSCGHRCIDWSKVSYPVKSMKPLTQSGAIIDSTPISGVDDIRAFRASHTTGIHAMTKYHDEKKQS
jgi:hypothetical protein